MGPGRLPPRAVVGAYWEAGGSRAQAGDATGRGRDMATCWQAMGVGIVATWVVPHAPRAVAYRALFEDALPDASMTEIRGYLQQRKVPGSERFRARVETKTGHFAAVRPLDRPPPAPTWLPTVFAPA